MAMWRWFVLASLLSLVATAYGASLKTQIKAAYLYKFCQYVQWPDTTFVSEDAPIVIGVVNHDNLFEELRHIVAGRQIGERPVQVRRIDVRADAQEAVSGVHVLYLGTEAGTGLVGLADTAAQLPILTVAEEHNVDMPRILVFTISDNRVRFDVELEQAEKVGLYLSAELLSVARVVNRPPQEVP